MNARIVRKPQVELDLIEHFAFIARDKVAPAERFLKVAEQSFDRLASIPLLGRQWNSPSRSLKGIRVYPMPAGFRNYLIFYRPIENGVEIITVLHGARDIEKTLSRLE